VKLKSFLVGVALWLPLFFALSAKADEFSGTWSGTGRVDGQSREQAVSAKFVLTLKVTDDRFQIKECWDTGEGTPNAASCISSDYSLKLGDIFSENKKIGDVYPDYVTILDSNSQVSEQMLIRVSGDGSHLLYEYNYMNLDGVSTHRKVLLTKIP
jgi:hypothetical protein